MKFDELYKFLGYCLVSLLLFYIVAKSIRFQLGIIEGLVGIKKDKKTKDDSKQGQTEEGQTEEEDQTEEDQTEEDQTEEDQTEEEDE